MKSISSREIIATRIGYLATLPKSDHLWAIENIKQHALTLGIKDEEFEEFLTSLLSQIVDYQKKLLDIFTKRDFKNKET